MKDNHTINNNSKSINSNNIKEKHHQGQVQNLK